MWDTEINHIGYGKNEVIKKEDVIVENKIVEKKVVLDEKALFGLTKEEQIKKLKELGLADSEIKKLNTEIKRVNKIIELGGK